MKYQHYNYFKRVLALFIIFITGAVLGTSVFSTIYFGRKLRQSVASDNYRTMEIINNQVDRNLRLLATFGRSLAYDSDVQNSFRKIQNEKEIFHHFTLIHKLNQRTRTYVYLNETYLYDIVLVSADGEVLNTENTYQTIFDEYNDQSFFEEEYSGFAKPFEFAYTVNQGEAKFLPYVQNVYDIQNREYLGKVIILSKYNTIFSPFIDAFGESGMAEVFVTNRRNEYLYCSEDLHDRDDEVVISEMSAKQGTSEFEEKIAGGDVILHLYVSERYVSAQINRLLAIVLVVILVTLLVILTAAWFIVKRMLNPLQTLVEGLQKVAEGERKVHLESRGKSEVDGAIEAFNNMVLSIDESTTKLVESERRNTDMRIRMLFYQINPHFIYNTLNAALCLIRQNENTKVIQMIRTLIEFLRSILSYNNVSFASIKEEKEHIDRYIELLQYSYESVSNVEWEVDEELMREPILKQVLYPIVENSILHGILPCQHKCTITITVEDLDKRIRVMVMDNGVGMKLEEQERLAEKLQNKEMEQENGKHIGLRNVNRRLQLVYGEGAGIHFSSEEGNGTAVWFEYCMENQNVEIGGFIV